MPMYFDIAKNSAQKFKEKLQKIKDGMDANFTWYPYDTMANFWHIDSIVTEEFDFLFKPGKKYADIGAADGDLAFYMEALGNECDIYDNAPTNMNGLHGARALKSSLVSSVNIIERDLDSQFSVSNRYDLIFFFGILYHLKNPFFILEKLSVCSSYMFLSTRITRSFQSNGGDLSGFSAAYLVSPDEMNNDATNFWIFTDAGLKRILDRAGWDVVGYRTVGDTVNSNPQDNAHDERAFALLRSKNPVKR